MVVGTRQASPTLITWESVRRTSGSAVDSPLTPGYGLSCVVPAAYANNRENPARLAASPPVATPACLSRLSPPLPLFTRLCVLCVLPASLTAFPTLPHPVACLSPPGCLSLSLPLSVSPACIFIASRALTDTLFGFSCTAAVSYLLTCERSKNIAKRPNVSTIV